MLGSIWWYNTLQFSLKQNLRGILGSNSGSTERSRKVECFYLDTSICAQSQHISSTSTFDIIPEFFTFNLELETGLAMLAAKRHHHIADVYFKPSPPNCRPKDRTVFKSAANDVLRHRVEPAADCHVTAMR